MPRKREAYAKRLCTPCRRDTFHLRVRSFRDGGTWYTEYRCESCGHTFIERPVPIVARALEQSHGRAHA
jgi:transposase-like protein